MISYQRWVTLSYLLLAAIAWFIVRQIGDLIWDLARFPVPEQLPLSPPELIGFMVAATVFVVFRRNPRINTFANEVAAELAKVTWAPRKETAVSTGVISIVVAVCSLALFLIDTVWGTLMKLWYK